MLKANTLLILLILTFSCSMPGNKKKNTFIRSFDTIPVLNQYVEEPTLILTDTIIDHGWDHDTSINGRKLKEIRKILSGKNFSKLQQYNETAPDGNKRLSAWNCLRDLIGTYREGLFYFENAIPDKTNPAICTINTFRVVFIVTANKLIYYEIGEKRYTGQTLFHFTLIEKYKNEIEYNGLKNAFRNIYSEELNEQELFIESIVYGEYCGFAGTNPKEKDMIDDFVKNKDKEKLLTWLRSTNTEKQIYAVDGFCRLDNLGLKLTEQEMKMIFSVLSKKGTINTCHGCILCNKEITDVVSKFKFVIAANHNI